MKHSINFLILTDEDFTHNDPEDNYRNIRDPNNFEQAALAVYTGKKGFKVIKRRNGCRDELDSASFADVAKLVEHSYMECPRTPLEKLEDLARKAKNIDLREAVRGYTAMSYHDACSPDLILNLIQVVKAAKLVLNPNPEDPDFSMYRLGEALMEIK